MADAVAARQIPIVCPGHSRPLAEVYYSGETPDGVFLMSGCHAKTPMIRRADTGDWVGTFEGHKGAVWGVALDKDAMLAATASADFTARLWDCITGDQLHEFAHKHIVKSVEFSSDRSQLATGGHEGVLRIFDLGRPEIAPAQITTFPEGKTVQLSKVRWGKDQNTIVTGSADGSVKVWDLRTNQQVHNVTVKGAVMDLEVSRTLDIVTVAAGSTVSFFNSGTFQMLQSHTTPMNFQNEGGASLHPSGDRFIAGGSDVCVRVFDFSTGVEKECLRGHHGPVRCLRYAPEGVSYATGSEDGTIRIWATNHPDDTEQQAG